MDKVSQRRICVLICLFLVATLLIGCDTEPAPVNTEPREEAIADEILSTYFFHHLTPHLQVGHVLSDFSLRFRGTFSDTYVVFIDGPIEYADSQSEDYVNGQVFSYPNGQKLLAYHQGMFYTVLEAFDLGYLTDEDILQLKSNYDRLGASLSEQGQIPTTREACTHTYKAPTEPTVATSPEVTATEPTQPTTPPETKPTDAYQRLPDMPTAPETAVQPDVFTLESLVYTIYEHTVTWENKPGTGYETLNIRAPAIVPFCEGAIAINKQIRSDYQSEISSWRWIYQQQYPQYSKDIYYEAYLSDNILTIQITEWSSKSLPMNTFYFLDIATGQQLEAKDMLQRYLPESYPAFLQRCTYNLTEYYRKNPLDPNKYGHAVATMPTNAELMRTYVLFPGHNNTLMIAFFVPGSNLYYVMPYDEFAAYSWEADEDASYGWLFHLSVDEYNYYSWAELLLDSFFLDSQKFVETLSQEDQKTVAHIAYALCDVSQPIVYRTRFTELCESILAQSEDPKIMQTVQALLGAKPPQ